MRAPAPALQAASKPIHRVDAEIAIGCAVLAAALVIGVATAPHYGITIDEFNTEDYGPKALAWYLSGFADRSALEFVEMSLYGPWAQMLIAAAQRLGIADPLTVRHAVTFVIGLSGVATLLPLGRLVAGRWVGLTAVVLCLITGYLYGLLFFAPIDSPFLAAMGWSTLAIVLMTRRDAPSWGLTVMTGVAIGLAIGIRTGGIIALAYLFGALALCALDLMLRQGRRAAPAVAGLALRFAAAAATACLVAYALWPWLQVGNPFSQFAAAYTHFVKIPMVMAFPSWGRTLSTTALPWHYVAEQLLARLPELFIVLLLVALVAGLVKLAGLIRKSAARCARLGLAGLQAPGLWLARSRGLLVVLVAGLAPPLIVMAQGTRHYDGIRHLLFIIPMLAILAGWGLKQIAPLVLRFPKTAAALGAAQLAWSIGVLVMLHPLQYVATNAFAGGIWGSHGRFELDFWSAAGTQAVRQLDRRLQENPALAPGWPPRVIDCNPYRMHDMGRVYPKHWIVELDAAKAHFLIETERFRCTEARNAELIDAVTRLGRAFAWIYRARPR